VRCGSILTAFCCGETPDCQNAAFVLFHHLYFGTPSPDPRLIVRFVTISALFAVLTLALSATSANAQSGAADGQKIAFDRGKGNCLSCHQIKGGDFPGSIGPPLNDVKAKYPDRNQLVAIVSDETKRNPSTVMPPFGRNRILTEQEINAVVDFLQTL
jgi:L-cysteine S-thiosulfotransferase